MASEINSQPRAFIVMGVAGVLLVLPFRLIVRDPPRTVSSSATSVPLTEAFVVLGRKWSFWLVCLATGIGSMCTYGLNFWLPSVLGRSFGLDLFDRVNDDYFAIGTGAIAALVAMDLGLDPVAAVEAACRRDANSGLPVEHMEC